MKKIIKLFRNCKDYKIWLFLLFITDILFGGFLWLADVEAFFALLGLMVFVSIFLFIITLFYISQKENKREIKVMEFLNEFDKLHEEDACRGLSEREQKQLRLFGEKLRGKEKKLVEQEIHLNEYEEYIESWAHEVKTPLSLMTLMLDNRKDEMSSTVYWKMEYARKQMEEEVNQMLYYGRLKSVHKEYLFEEVLLSECCEEALEEFQVFFKEQDFEIKKELGTIKVVTDKKSFHFILGQIISNAIKYRKPDETHPMLALKAELGQETKKVLFSVIDNGMGVKSYDLPFLFEKGFTGDIQEHRKKSTGIGLYLVKQMAEDLKIKVDIISEYGKGVEVLFYFPI